MDTRLWEYYLAVCDCKSIAKAADKLFLSRQALSYALNKIERELGVILLERSSNGIRLTEAGDRFYERCNEAVRHWHETQNILAVSAKNTALTIRVGFCSISLNILGIDNILAYEKSHPGIHLDIRSMLSEECWPLLQQGELDFACTILPPETGSFKSTLFYTDRVHVLVSRKNPLSRQETISAEDISHTPLLFRTPSEKLIQDTCNAWKALGYSDLTIKTYSLDQTSFFDLIAADYGVYLVLGRGVPVFDNTKVRGIPLEKGVMDSEFYLVQNNGRKLSSAAQGFYRYLVKLSTVSC